MKVALVAHDRYPIAAPFAGGLESFTWHLANGLRERGMDVVLFAGPGSDPALEAEELQVRQVELSSQARADVAMPPEHQVQETFAYLQLVMALRDRTDIDVVHNNALHYLPVALAPVLAQPVITTLHTPPTPWLEPALALTPGVRTVAVSKAVAAMWRPQRDSLVIHNGVDTDLWTEGPGGEALVWTGRLVPEKAPHVAAMIARAAGWPLRIAGPASDPIYVEAMLKPLLGDGIEWVGHLALPELHALVSTSAAALVTPAWDEPYGLVAAEAMASGTPVLALARGGLPEFVHGPGGACVPVESSLGDTVAAAAAALPDVLALDRAEVRRHAMETCSLDVMIDRYVRLYEELTS